MQNITIPQAIFAIRSSMDIYYSLSCALTQTASVSMGSDFALLTFKSAVDGKCDGQPVPGEWDTTVYAKEGGVWKAVYTGSSPAS